MSTSNTSINSLILKPRYTQLILPKLHVLNQAVYQLPAPILVQHLGIPLHAKDASWVLPETIGSITELLDSANTPTMNLGSRHVKAVSRGSQDITTNTPSTKDASSVLMLPLLSVAEVMFLMNPSLVQTQIPQQACQHRSEAKNWDRKLKKKWQPKMQGKLVKVVAPKRALPQALLLHQGRTLVEVVTPMRVDPHQQRQGTQEVPMSSQDIDELGEIGVITPKTLMIGRTST